MEDVLQIYIKNPAMSSSKALKGPCGTLPSPTGLSSNLNESDNSMVDKYIPVLRKFSGNGSNWPKEAVILPGHEILFSLETASDYVKDEQGAGANKAVSSFGFRCLVVGYEAIDQREQGLKNLEAELSYLGGLCAASLMKKTLALQTSGSEDSPMEEDLDHAEESAADAFDMHR